MIPAKKDPLRDSILYLYLRRMLRKNFHVIRASGMEHLRDLKKNRPTIAFANHTNWWDGLVLFYLSRCQKGKDFYCMMEEKQMKHYPFFSWLGAFSVDLENKLRAPGVNFLASRFANAQMLPMVMHFEFEREQPPCVYLRIGKPYLAADGTEERLQQELVKLHRQLKEEVKQREFDDYETIFTAGVSINKRWEWIKRLFSGNLKGFRQEN